VKIIKVDQNTPEWHEIRHGKAGGSDAKALYPLSRGTDKTPAGIWDLVGQMLTKYSEVQNAMQRGHDLEDEAITLLEAKTGLEFDHEPGMWVSDTNSALSLSPDAAEKSGTPTYSAEIKHLGAGKHFKYLYKQLNYSGNPIDLIPNEAGSYYKEQSLQYFAVNENLKRHFFVMRHPDAIYEEHKMLIIEIHRSDVEHLIDEHRHVMNQAINIARTKVAELTKDLF
jgi:hypothetical protein